MVDDIYEVEIEAIISSKFVPKVGKHIVRLAHRCEKAEEIWMTEKQLMQIERVFEQTKHCHSTQRAQVVAVMNGNFYKYAKLKKTDFIEPHQFKLEDLRDDS